MSDQRATDFAPPADEPSFSRRGSLLAPLCGNLLLILGGCLILPWEKPWIFSGIGGCLILTGSFLRDGWTPNQTAS